MKVQLIDCDSATIVWTGSLDEFIANNRDLDIYQIEDTLTNRGFVTFGMHGAYTENAPFEAEQQQLVRIADA